MKTRLNYLFVSLALLAIGNVARSATITWTNTTGGNWNDAASWNPNQVPGSGDSASIPGGAINVVVDATISAGGLTLHAPSSLTIMDSGVLNILGNAALFSPLTNRASVSPHY